MELDLLDTASLSSDEPSPVAPPLDNVASDLLEPLVVASPSNHDFTYFDDLNFDTLEQDVLYVLVIGWRILVGLAGLLDASAGLASMLPPRNSESGSLVQWLTRHGNRLGMLFSLVWFCDAILGAYQKYRDQQTSVLNASADLKGASGSVCSLALRLVVLQLLVLPVGIYISLYRLILRLTNQPLWDETTHPILWVHSDNCSDITAATPLATDTILSGTILLALHVWIRLSQYASKRMSQGRARLLRKAIVLIIQLFVQNPLLFNKRVKMTHLYLNWTKNIAKLVEKLNQLVQKALTVKVNLLQWWQSTLARRARRRLRRTLSSASLRDYNATIIAATFRRYLAQRQVKLLKLEQELQHSAACKVQACFRRRLWRARFRLQKENRSACALDVQATIELLERSNKYRKMLFDLESEMKRDVKELINDRMLIAPNSSFSVAWGLITVLAILFEATHLAIDPILADRPKSDKELPRSLKEWMTARLIPQPVSSNPVCRVNANEWLQPLIDLVRHVMRQPPPKPAPWWCRSHVFASIQGWYIVLTGWIFDHFASIVSIILLTDVFVTLFTGYFDRTTKMLRPIVGFRRWIFPGLFFQFLVNPHMEPASLLVRKLAAFVFMRGVLRVYQWCVVSFYPLIRLSVWGAKYLRQCWCSNTIESNPASSKLHSQRPSFDEIAARLAQNTHVVNPRNIGGNGIAT